MDHIHMGHDVSNELILPSSSCNTPSLLSVSVCVAAMVGGRALLCDTCVCAAGGAPCSATAGGDGGGGWHRPGDHAGLATARRRRVLQRCAH
eukprot:6194352-Pleurochrysis_carterae.AAC.3